jgi:ribosomal protein S12 methylthiotransferase
MALQQPIAFEHAESLIGYELDVLIDEQTGEGGLIGRTFADAPEIDATVTVQMISPPSAELPVGEFVPVEITGRVGYDLIGTMQ